MRTFNMFKKISALVFIFSLFFITASFTHAQQDAQQACGRYADVQQGSTFYEYIRVLGCRAVMNGYPCGGTNEQCLPPDNFPYFRPSANLTRGQASKIIALSAGYNDAVSGQSYEDVLPGSTFYQDIERLKIHNVIGGYPCGGVGEPCVHPTDRPYFRPGGDVTRAQLAKMTAIGAGFNETVSGQTFEDIVPGSTFYSYIERLATRHIVSGYPCGGVGEPCNPPGLPDANLPYFRQNASITRQQASQFIAIAFFKADITPTPSISPPTGQSPTPGGSVTPVAGCPKKPIGDADCNNTVDFIDYSYYVATVNGGRVPDSVSADFNKDGEVGLKDRNIIIATLNGGSNSDGTPSASPTIQKAPTATGVPANQ